MKNKGFSLVEVMVSAGAFAVFAILIQNVLLLAHSFQISQRNLLDTFQINQMIKQKVCIANSSFTNRNIKWNLSYTKLNKPLGGTTENNGENIAPSIHATEYTTLSEFSSAPLLKLEDKDVLQDSHTLVVVNSNHQTLQKPANGKSADFLSGYVFASRCVPVSTDSIKTANGHKATFNSQDLKASAKEILEQEHRPYYFAKSTQRAKDESVLCCKDGSDQDQCKSAIQHYAPRIYVIHFVRSEIDLTSSQAIFAGHISAIQELPELQDMDNMWGAGFMLSMNQRQLLSQSVFNLDIMVLKNTCSTSLGHIKNCATLSLAINPFKQDLIGNEGSDLNMGQFITADISSCSGYASGVDTGSAIVF